MKESTGTVWKMTRCGWAFIIPSRGGILGTTTATSLLLQQGGMMLGSISVSGSIQMVVFASGEALGGFLADESRREE